MSTVEFSYSKFIVQSGFHAFIYME